MIRFCVQPVEENITRNCEFYLDINGKQRLHVPTELSPPCAMSLDEC